MKGGRPDTWHDPAGGSAYQGEPNTTATGQEIPMRPVTLLRLALPAALLLGCGDRETALEPATDWESPVAAADPDAPEAALATGRWAAGYTTAGKPTLSTYNPSGDQSYNRSGQRIVITKPAGTTGRYVVTFPGLSAVIGVKSTVHVTAGQDIVGYCASMAGTLVTDKVEVRCYRTGTGAAANATFSIAVLGKGPDRAFAFANQPTAATYAPASAGSSNPAGTMKVVRYSTGNYGVVFANLGTRLSGVSGQEQVQAVGGKAYCKGIDGWGGNPDVTVGVQCYSAAGTLVDAKFTVLVQLPASKVAYAYISLPTQPSLPLDPHWNWNPSGSAVAFTRLTTGEYSIEWPFADGLIVGYGTVQVTAITGDLFDNSRCTASHGYAYARVKCYAANGVPVDVPFTVLIGS